jgi:hypothetical protein
MSNVTPLTALDFANLHKTAFANFKFTHAGVEYIVPLRSLTQAEVEKAWDHTRSIVPKKKEGSDEYDLESSDYAKQVEQGGKLEMTELVHMGWQGGIPGNDTTERLRWLEQHVPTPVVIGIAQRIISISRSEPVELASFIYPAA